MLKEGLKLTMEKIVENKDSAKEYGSGLVDVFATPAMIGLMENVSKNSVQDELEEGFTTVGVEVNVKHIKATPIGMKVTCTAEVIKIDGKMMTFKVEAFDEVGKIGEGTHTRCVINSEKFLKRIYGDKN